MQTTSFSPKIEQQLRSGSASDAGVLFSRKNKTSQTFYDLNNLPSIVMQLILFAVIAQGFETYLDRLRRIIETCN